MVGKNEIQNETEVDDDGIHLGKTKENVKNEIHPEADEDGKRGVQDDKPLKTGGKDKQNGDNEFQNAMTANDNWIHSGKTEENEKNQIQPEADEDGKDGVHDDKPLKTNGKGKEPMSSPLFKILKSNLKASFGAVLHQ
ncbi:hypothetical protein V2J09_020985 [Rumex salicifolius]